MSSKHWHADETVTFIAIIKSLKDQMVGLKRILDWQEVATQMAENECVQTRSRSITELREKYRKLRNDYFKARYEKRSCQYYNYLDDLFEDEVRTERQEDDSEEDEEFLPEVEQEYDEVEEKYADMLEFTDIGDADTNRCLGAAGKLTQRSKWVEGEVETLLSIITTNKLQSPLLSRRNAKVFKLLARKMASRGFVKSADQIRVKYHQLKNQYAKAKSNGESFAHFEDMHSLLNGHADSSGGEALSDSNDSGEENAEAMALASDSASETALVAAIPNNARVKWKEGEVDVFLDIINKLGLQTALLRKRNAKIFRLLSKEMAKRSFDKPAEKLRIKFQHLRRQYNKAKAGGESFEHFEAMDQLLNPADQAEQAKGETPLSSGSESDIYSEENDADSNRRPPDSYYWTDSEVDAFLTIIKQNNLFRALDGSKKRNFKTLTYISNLLAGQGFQRTPHQLRNKLRLLLRRYQEVQQHGLRNVRLLPRHCELLDELMQKKRTSSTKAAQPDKGKGAAGKDVPKKRLLLEESDSEESSSGYSCDLLRAAADSDAELNGLELAPEPTPLQVLSSISAGQKELLAMLSTSHEQFLQQQREMQQQFLQEMSNIMRQEREATFRMLRELTQPK